MWPFTKKRAAASGAGVHDPVLKALAPWRARHQRTAWRPVIGDGPGLSQFGGAPALPAGEAWPVCGGCGRRIDLFLQLDGRETPAGSPWHGTGVLQVFYCRECEPDLDGWAPFSKAHLLRSLPAEGLTAGPSEGAPLERKAIVGWTAFDDLPAAAEQDELGLQVTYDFRAERVSVTCEDFGVSITDLDLNAKDAEGREIAEALSETAAKDKLGGWPCWVQGVEYPECPRCQAKMRLVFQIDSEDNIDYMFGDVGCGHVTQCPEHPEVLAFGWACS